MVYRNVNRKGSKMSDWPAPDLLPYLFFENPWPIASVAGVIGLVLLIAAVRQRSRLMGFVGLDVIGLAVVVVVLASMVDSTREKLIERTKALAHAAAPQLDTEALDELFAPSVAFYVGPADRIHENVREVLELADRAHRRYTFKSMTVQSVDARRTAEQTAESFLSVSTTLAGQDDSVMAMFGEGAFQTGWLFHWKQHDGRWKVHRITWMQFRGQEPAASLLP
jgi:hypothetical protein